MNKFAFPKPASVLATTKPQDVIPAPSDIPAGTSDFATVAAALVASKGKSGLTGVGLKAKEGINEKDVLANIRYVAYNSELSDTQKDAAVAYLLGQWYDRQSEAGSAGIVNFQAEYRKVAGGGKSENFQENAGMTS